MLMRVVVLAVVSCGSATIGTVGEGLNTCAGVGEGRHEELLLVLEVALLFVSADCEWMSDIQVSGL